MELRHFRYVIAVAEELNFGRAAERLNMCQPPLSHQIRLLEEELGVKLFERTKRRVEVTEAGLRLVDEARKTGHFLAVRQKDVQRSAVRGIEGRSFGMRIAADNDLKFAVSL